MQASTATSGMHDAGAVSTWVLHNEATLPLMCVGGRELIELFGRPFQELAFVCMHTMDSPEMSSKVIQLNAQFCIHGGYLHTISNTLTSHYYHGSPFQTVQHFCIHK